MRVAGENEGNGREMFVKGMKDDRCEISLTGVK